MMPPILSVISKKGCGKTTLIEKIIGELKRRGYKIGTVKHDTHGFDMDHEGKDTWRHKQAGAAGVLISSPWKITLIHDVDEELWLDELVEKYMQGYDLIVTEGFRQAGKTQVEVWRAAQANDGSFYPCKNSDDSNMLAIMTNDALTANVPVLGLDDYISLVDLIETKLLKL